MPDMPKLTTNEKLGLSLFVFICVFALVVQFFRLPQSLVKPFGRTGTGDFKTIAEQEAEEIQRQKMTDTDHDGLTDYDEMNIYRTSAFNEDTDSDGIPDGVEVKRGTDPNCPEGKACRVIVPSTTPENAPVLPANISESELNVMTAVLGVFGELDQITPESVKQRVDKMSSKELRDFLLKLSIPQKALDQTDDATLKQMLVDTISELAAENANAPAATNSSAGTNSQ